MSRVPVRAVLVGAAAAVFLAGAGDAFAQCAMCRAALSSSAEGRGIGEQFNRAILVMFFAPYVLVGTFAAVAYRRRLRLAAGRLLAAVSGRAAPR